MQGWLASLQGGYAGHLQSIQSSKLHLRPCAHCVLTFEWLVALGLPLMLAIGLLTACWTDKLHSTCSALPLANSFASDAPRTHIPAVQSPEWRPWLKQHNVRVSAICFYGRRRYVRILSGYLKKQLISHGGILEEVLWFVRTKSKQDVAWLNQVLLPSEPAHYKGVRLKGNFKDPKAFNRHYQTLDSHVYFKVDDDVMFIEQHAIEQMLHEKLKGRFLIVSANVINHTILTWIHAAMGAMTSQPGNARKEILGSVLDNLTTEYLDRNLFKGFQYGPYQNCSWASPECATLCHSFFLQNAAMGHLDMYDFHLWDLNAFDYKRWSINVIIFKGSDLNHEVMDKAHDDEYHISKLLPRRLDQHCGAVGPALAVHLAYFTQRGAGLREQDILPLYERLAEKLTGTLLPV